MKKQILVATLHGFALFALAGCSGQQSTGEQGTGQQTPTAGGASKAVRAALTVTPGSVSTCEADTHINPVVAWQRNDVAIKKTKVTVSAPGSTDEKLFASAGFGGSTKAGDWVVPGVTFRLYDADTSAILASYTVTASPCAN